MSSYVLVTMLAIFTIASTFLFAISTKKILSSYTGLL